jgi:ribokinase
MIHVAGNAAVDTMIRLDCFPRPGETVVARGASDDLGGKGANQAVVVARCGQNVRLVAAVGADAIGARIRVNLAAEGVETDGLWTWPGASDRCVICVDRHGENTIVSLIDAARNFDPLAKTTLEHWIAPGDWVVLQGNLRAGASLSPSRGRRRRRSIHRPPFPFPTTTGASSTSSFSIAAKRSNSAAASIRSRPRARSSTPEPKPSW